MGGYTPDRFELRKCSRPSALSIGIYEQEWETVRDYVFLVDLYWFDIKIVFLRFNLN